MAKDLSEKQKLFLEYLFHETVMGDFDKAKELAGYSPTTLTSWLIDSVKEDLIEHTKLYLAKNAPKAAFGVMNVMDNPGLRGQMVRLSAAKEVLDRVGVVKTEKIEVQQGAFILPPKQEAE
jgi:hypothetical protein